MLSSRTRRPVKAAISLAALLFLVLHFSPGGFSTSREDSNNAETHPPSHQPSRSSVLLQYVPTFPTPTLSPPVRKILGKHRFRPDGLVEVNLEGPHPIYELISRAEQEWEAKHARASQTLDQAVAEYKRRYKRNPPKGFDLWRVFPFVPVRTRLDGRLGGSTHQSITFGFLMNMIGSTATWSLFGVSSPRTS